MGARGLGRAGAAGGLLVLLAGPGLARAGQIEPALSVEYGSPQKLSGNLGIWMGTAKPGGHDYGQGVLLQVQPGLGGVSLNVGFTPFAFSTLGSQALGFAVKARLLRTWGTPHALEPDRTYAGFEAALALGVKVSVGALWKVGGDPGKASIVTWSVGFGL
jgi:hypothetical protein